MEAPMAEAEPYVIWSNEHRCWWAAGERGYRRSLADAGRYGRDHALKICARARGGREFNENPTEVPILLKDAEAFWGEDREEWRQARMSRKLRRDGGTDG
jgi:hypothetical protein